MVQLTPLIKKIQDTEYFIFDFDGTLYPQILLVDLALDYFKKKDNFTDSACEGKCMSLKNLIRHRGEYSFSEISKKFANLLTDVRCQSFYSELQNLLKSCYPASIAFIDKLNESGKKCFLVSLTTEKVAKEVTKIYGFRDYYCRDLEKELREGSEVFTGRYPQKIDSLRSYKEASLSKFGIAAEKFFMAGDSVEDTSLISKAYIKVLVNPLTSLKGLNPDLVLNSQKDPWGQINQFYKIA